MTVIVDERSAAFFALGAAQASGAPVAILCTSGTAAANYHPAICEADESALPLIALTADRPPELRGIGAGQTLDQVKLYGSAVRWFCEVGTHEAGDDGLLHLRSTACRAFAAARGEPRPGPVHLNLPWREPLSPLPVAGAVTAIDPLALEGRGGQRPLTAVTPIDPEPSGFLLEEVGKHIAEAISGVIVAGRQSDPELREPLAHLAAASGFPILAEPTSQLRCGPHDRSHVIAGYDLLLRDEHFRNRVVPDLVLRFGEMPTSKPLRRWLAASGADQIVVDPSRRLERAEPPGGGDPAGRPDRAGGRLGGSGRAGRSRVRRALASLRRRGGRGPGEGARRRGADHRAGPAARAGRRTRRWTTSSTPPRACRSATRRRSCPPAPPARASSATAAPTASTGWSPRGSARRRRAAARRRSSPATSGCSTTSAASPPCARSRRRSGSSSSTTTAAESSTSSPRPRLWTARSSRPCSALLAASASPRPPPSSTYRTAAWTRSHELPDALAAGTGLIEVNVDRQANANLHRHLAASVSQALAAARL